VRAKAFLKLGWIDINAPIDPETEGSILHYACKNENNELLQWALDNGADTDVKDKKGKLPSALLKKDSKLKSLLKHGLSSPNMKPFLKLQSHHHLLHKPYPPSQEP
jgi:ankyrin repeat protein